MIPDQYWTLARRWFWLLALFAIVGAASAVYVLPPFIGSSSSFDSSATLGASHYISMSRIVTTGEANPDDDDAVAAGYTASLAAYASTPQFIANLQEKLATQGIILTRQEIKKMTDISANAILFRIDVHASAESRDVTEALITNATDALIARAEDEEARVAWALISSLERQQAELVTRLEALAEEEKGIGAARDPIIIDLETTVIGEELEQLTRQREQLILSRTYSRPLVMVNPPQTVETEGNVLAARELLLLGATAGLLVGWAGANLAERVRSGNRGQTTRNGSQANGDEARSIDPRLLILAERAAEIERRARALDNGLVGASRHARVKQL